MVAQYEMKFDPHTIEHLGVKMYSTLPPALAELISNAYDADAENVTLTFLEVGGNKSISVKDNGSGMSSIDIQERFLVIGRNRRRYDGDKPSPKFKRYATGKKGLGKLALFGLAKEIVIDTVKDNLRNRFVLNWDELLNAEGVYTPRIEISNESTKKKNGTTIKLSKLKRQSSFNIDSIADSLSKIFIVDNNFNIILEDGNKKIIQVDNTRRYNGFDKQFEWDLESIIDKDDYYFTRIKGKFYTSTTPIRPNSGLRGVSLFSRGKLVNSPEFFSNSTSSHFFQYLTGWVSADFIDELSDDVISTNRQSVDWDNLEMQKLRAFLSSLISKVNYEWRIKRKEKKGKDLEIKTGIDIKGWMNTMPDEMKSYTTKIIEYLEKEDALEQYSPIIEALHSIVPEYPMLHWRHLNKELKARVEQYYINGQYALAADQGTKIYCEILRSMTTQELDGIDLINKVLSPKNYIIQICEQLSDTDKNRQAGQYSLSKGVIEAFRNPVSHMPVDRLVPEIYSELDCLNILSLISFLTERLDGAEIIEP